MRRAMLWAALAVVLIGCARVQSPISLPDVELGDPSFYPTLQAYAGASIVGGNAVTILLNGDQIFPAMLQAIRGARNSIVYSQYYYEGGDTALAVAQALAERSQAGVPVHDLPELRGHDEGR